MRHWGECLCVFGVRRWLGISGQDRHGYHTMDKACENLALLRGVLLPSYPLLDQRDKTELRGC